MSSTYSNLKFELIGTGDVGDQISYLSSLTLGSALPVASGGTVTTAGGYTYHTFTSSGTFTA
jgi:hypothetical protein